MGRKKKTRGIEWDVPLIMVVDYVGGVAEETTAGGIGRDAQAVLLYAGNAGGRLLRLERKGDGKWYVKK